MGEKEEKSVISHSLAFTDVKEEQTAQLRQGRHWIPLNRAFGGEGREESVVTFIGFYKHEGGTESTDERRKALYSFEQSILPFFQQSGKVMLR